MLHYIAPQRRQRRRTSRTSRTSRTTVGPTRTTIAIIMQRQQRLISIQLHYYWLLHVHHDNEPSSCKRRRAQREPDCSSAPDSRSSVRNHGANPLLLLRSVAAGSCSKLASRRCLSIGLKFHRANLSASYLLQFGSERYCCSKFVVVSRRRIIASVAFASDTISSDICRPLDSPRCKCAPNTSELIDGRRQIDPQLTASFEHKYALSADYPN